MFPKGEIYKRFIENNFEIVDKKGVTVPLIFNEPQNKYLNEGNGQDIILKARQEGFSTLIDAIFTTDFLLKENSFSVIVADIEDNAVGLLDRVKFFLSSYSKKHKIRLPLKYNSRFELFNSFKNSRLLIGTAKNTDFGRSKTISNLHFSELAFYPDISKMIAGCGQAVVEGGRKICETTANGFNEFRDFYFSSKRGETGYNTLFFKASDFYSAEFLTAKQRELKDRYHQEYPNTDLDAFISTGQMYFDRAALSDILKFTQIYRNIGNNNVLASVSGN